MNPDTRRTLLAVTISMLILVVWARLQSVWYPPRPNAASPSAATQPAPSSDLQQPAAAASPTTRENRMEPTLSADATPTRKPSTFTPVDARDASSPRLGLDAPRSGKPPNPYLIALKFDSRGAGIETADLTDYRNTVPRGKNPPPDTYDVLRPLTDSIPNAPAVSMASRRVRFVEEKSELDLGVVHWAADSGRDEGGDFARFILPIQRNGRPVLQATKTFHIRPNSRIVHLELQIENRSDKPESIIWTEGGPVGIPREEPRSDDRFAYAQLDDSAKPHQRREVWNSEDHTLELSSEQHRVVWAGLGNKYFGCIMAPASGATSAPVDFVKKVTAITLRDTADHEAGDLTTEWVLAPPGPLAPGATFRCAFDIYLGPRNLAEMARDAALVGNRFDRFCGADRSGCTFEWLSQLMRGLFALLHRFLPGTHNYGLAIILLVLIVRGLLHPLTRRTQINMAKTQKAMASLGPKMEVLKQKYANDKQKLNQEMMALYQTEGVHPASTLLSCLPMMLQMPIWVALWSTLNSSIELRHEPFILWIRDLSSPDALISFNQAFQIPLIGAITGPIHAFNVLPIIMGITMYLQQKFSQKAMKANAPTPPPAPSGQPNPADQMASQQKMMNFMTIFFAMMFYASPSGLNIYILTSNIAGMIEQRLIRQHMKDRELRGDPPSGGKPPQKKNKPGWLEKLQKTAEEARQVRGKPVRR